MTVEKALCLSLDPHQGPVEDLSQQFIFLNGKFSLIFSSKVGDKRSASFCRSVRLAVLDHRD